MKRVNKMRTLRDLGEDAVVKAITRQLPVDDTVQVGPGIDDCAVVGSDKEPWQLLKTDVVIEGVHFFPTDKPELVGQKALSRAISDIAAMGGIPRYALVTLAVSPDKPMAWVLALYKGLGKIARKYAISIVGGETARSPGPVFINVALTGLSPKPYPATRFGARPGDAMYVTGRLGGSLKGRHLTFTPRIDEGAWLVKNYPPHAMMDVSDGLMKDASRLVGLTQCGMLLEYERIPRNRGCTVEQALNDGEDYELLFTIPPGFCGRLERAWKRRFPKLPLTRIGWVTDGHANLPDLQKAMKRAAKRQPKNDGYDHFA